MGTSRFSKGAGKIAISALLTALAVLLLYFSAILPAGRWAMIAIAGLCPAAVVVSAGLPAGALTYVAAALLGLLLAPDKGNILLFVLFFGLYPLVKSFIERLRKLPIELLCKLIFFNIVLTIFSFLLTALFLPMLPDLLQNATWLLYLAGNIVFLIYDFGFTKLMWFYTTRIDRAVRK